jgi:hypothetical protein
MGPVDVNRLKQRQTLGACELGASRRRTKPSKIRRLFRINEGALLVPTGLRNAVLIQLALERRAMQA